MKNIIEDSRLKEMNFGDYEGEYIQDLKKKHDYFCLWHQRNCHFLCQMEKHMKKLFFV